MNCHWHEFVSPVHKIPTLPVTDTATPSLSTKLRYIKFFEDVAGLSFLFFRQFIALYSILGLSELVAFQRQFSVCSFLLLK